MSLYNDLLESEVSISKGKDGIINALFCFNKELDLFKGHFPGQPILPGIIQFEMVKFAVEKTFESIFHIKSIKKTKFLGQIIPGEKIYITIKLHQEKNRFNVRATLQIAETTAGKLNMILLKEW